MAHDGPITVTGLDRTQQFADVDALAAHVAELHRTRGGVYNPDEWAAVLKLFELGNGATDDKTRLIALRAVIHTLPRVERGPSPFDKKIEKAAADEDAARVVMDAKYGEHVTAFDTFRAATATSSATRAMDMERLDAQAAYLAAEDVWRRARARHNALLSAREQWHLDEDQARAQG